MREVSTNCDSTSAISVFAWFDNPQLLSHAREASQVGVVLGRVEGVFKASEFPVCQALFNMVGQRQYVEGVLVERLVVALHVVENGLFVAQVEVVFLVIRCGQPVRSHVLLLGLAFVFAFAPETAASSVAEAGAKRRLLQIALVFLSAAWLGALFLWIFGAQH